MFTRAGSGAATGERNPGVAETRLRGAGRELGKGAQACRVDGPLTRDEVLWLCNTSSLP